MKGALARAVAPLRDLLGSAGGRKIFSAMRTISSLYLLVVLAYALREITIARQFGVSDAVDAFLIAYVVPMFAVSVFANTFNSAVVPTFIDVRERQGRDPAQSFLSNVLGLTLAVLLVAAALMALAYPFILPRLATGFSASKLALTRSLFYVIVPVVVLSGMNVVLTAVLNGIERFAIGAIAPATTPLATALTLWLWPAHDVYVIAAGVVVGALCEMAILLIALRRAGWAPRPAWPVLDEPTKIVARQYFSLVAGALMMSATPVIDQFMAAMLGGGAPSALSYGAKVVTFGSGLASIAIGTAVMPYFSKMVTNRDWPSLRASLAGYLLLIVTLTIPITIVFFIFSDQIVALLFESGRFDAADTQLVSRVQRCFAFQVPFYAMMVLLVRAISALRANHLLTIGALINVISCVALNYLFMPWLGVAGIALSTSCVYAISFVFSLLMVRRLLHQQTGTAA